MQALDEFAHPAASSIHSGQEYLASKYLRRFRLTFVKQMCNASYCLNFQQASSRLADSRSARLENRARFPPLVLPITQEDSDS